MSQVESTPAPAGHHGLWRYAFLVCIGAFATTFAQMKQIGQLPLNALLKDHFHLEREQVALFFFWGTFPWTVKPIAGVLTDAFPIFGTRRRHYMMVGAFMASLSWVVMGVLSDQYQALLGAALVMNAFMVLSSTVMGGMMVEAGQLFGAPGRISSLRQIIQSISGVIGPAIGGMLAGKAFGYTAGIGTATLLALAVSTFFVHKEARVTATAPLTEEERARPRFRPKAAVLAALAILAGMATGFASSADLRNIGVSLFALLGVFVVIVLLGVAPTQNPVIVRAQAQLTQIFASKTLWLAVLMLFLVYTVPGLHTSLYYMQTDQLKFSPQVIGGLLSIESFVGIGAAFAYAFLCRRVRLREMIIASVGLASIATFGYLVYDGDTAWWVHGSNGIVGVLAELALMDLAVRSTPKGCEALGFALMMAVRNFGISMSDVIGTLIMDRFAVEFSTMVVVNGVTTLAVLAFVVFLPAAVVKRREGEALVAVEASVA